MTTLINGIDSLDIESDLDTFGQLLNLPYDDFRLILGHLVTGSLLISDLKKSKIKMEIDKRPFNSDPYKKSTGDIINNAESITTNAVLAKLNGEPYRSIEYNNHENDQILYTVSHNLQDNDTLDYQINRNQYTSSQVEDLEINDSDVREMIETDKKPWDIIKEKQRKSLSINGIR